MSHILNQIGSGISRMFTIGGGAPPPPAPMPQALATPPAPTPPAPMPDPFSTAMMAARNAAAAKALGAQGRASTILTTARNRVASRPTIGAGALGQAYSATTLGGTS